MHLHNGIQGRNENDKHSHSNLKSELGGRGYIDKSMYDSSASFI